MALTKHLEEAADKLKKAGARLDEARKKPVTLQNVHEWLSALSDYSFALSELHDLNTATIQEQLDEIARLQRQSSSMPGP